MANFFKAGVGGLPENHPAYIQRRNLDDPIFKLALEGELFYVITPRQLGKTSLLKRLRARLRENGWRCVIVDLSTLLSLSMVEWYSALGEQLAAELTPGTSLTLTNHLNMRAYLTGETMQEGSHIAVFFDEVECAIKVRDEQGQPFSDAFFMTIRDLYQQKDSRKGKLTIGLTGAMGVRRLVQDRDISPFNAAREYKIHYLTRDETKELTKHLTKLNVQVDDAVHEEIYAWTNGHPYLAHRICENLEDLVKLEQIAAITVDDINQVVKRAFLQPIDSPGDSNILHVSDKINEGLPQSARPIWENIRQGIVTSRRSVDRDTYTDLYVTGVVIEDQDGYLVIRNRIYEEIFSIKNTENSSTNTNDRELQTLDPIIEEGYETPISSGNVVKFPSVITLLSKQGIDTKLIKNKTNLSNIATNWEVLRKGGIEAGLVNRWLGNGTHLDDAIAIMHQGVSLNLIGMSSKVRDFIGLAGASPNEVISRIPVEARILPWKPDPGRIEKGMKFGWTDASGQDWVVRMHEPDPEAPDGTNAASGWIVRIQRDNYYMDNAGNFSKENWLKPASSKYNSVNANGTHIPIQAP